MKATPELPLPELSRGRFAYPGLTLGTQVVPEGAVLAYTDEALFAACGVRIAFTGREGGLGEGAYAQLNLGAHVGDAIRTVLANRALVCTALAGTNIQLVVPKQVHGEHVVHVRAHSEVGECQAQAEEACDAVSVARTGVGALLCFADCVPVIEVLPTGAFAVVHAGWRGVENHIAVKALRELAALEAEEHGLAAEELIAGTNVYIGPYIHAECFEVGPETHAALVASCGEACAADANHINMGVALRSQLAEIGIAAPRIADVSECTVCNNAQYFSYRAQGGTCGRHGAFAVKVS